MDSISERLLDSFDHLPQQLQWQVASEILCCTLAFDFPPLSDDDDLLVSAEMVFLALDAREADDEQSMTLVPHTTSVRGSRFEVVVNTSFLRAGAFDA